MTTALNIRWAGNISSKYSWKRTETTKSFTQVRMNFLRAFKISEMLRAEEVFIKLDILCHIFLVNEKMPFSFLGTKN